MSSPELHTEHPPPPGYIPARTGRLLQVVAVLIDAFVVAIGVLTLYAPPESVVELGIYGGASTIWSAALIGGSVVAAVGALFGLVRPHIIGPFVAGSGFLIWAVAATAKTEATAQTYAVACLLGAAFLLSVWRGVAVAAAARLVEWRGV